MAEGYTWKITLADDTVKDESLGDKYALAWEIAGAIKSIELVNDGKSFKCTLATGEFNMNGDVQTLGAAVPNKRMFFRKRRQIRTDGNVILGARTEYVFGFVAPGDYEYTASVQPALEQLPEAIKNPSQKPKSSPSL